jgi:hypothetical protein
MSRILKRTAVAAAVALTATMLSLTGAPTAATAASDELCARGWVCTWNGPNFTGPRRDYYRCGHDDVVTFTYAHGSWINNQIGGARVQFKSQDHVTRWTSAAPYTEDRDADWSWVFYLRVC